MNHDSFSISRFGKYFAYDLKNGIFRNGPTLLIFLGIYLLVWIFLSIVLKIVTPVSDRDDIFDAIYFVFTTMTPGVIYGHVNDLKRGVGYILLPVTVFEKYLSMLVICLIFWPAVAMLGLKGMDALLTAAGGTEWGYVEYMPLFGDDGGVLYSDITSLLFTFSAFVYGNLLFRKRRYGLTLISFLVLVILFVQLINMFSLPGKVLTLLTYASIVLIVTAGYFRLKTLKY